MKNFNLGIKEFLNVLIEVILLILKIKVEFFFNFFKYIKVYRIIV